MTQFILHHFAMSPFSEKVRLILGAKDLPWLSVEVPMVMPKPDVVALTGGYRRTPILQVGADIYCDTALMCRLIDQVAPQVPLYPAAHQGLAEIVAQWADSALFWVAVPFTSQPDNRAELFADLSPEQIRALYEDRAAMAPAMRRPGPADATAQLHSHLARLQNMLADGRRFLFGEQPNIADFSVVHSLWYMRRARRAAAALQAYPAVLAWLDHMLAFGHGRPAALGSGEALATAAASQGFAPTVCEPQGVLVAGASVSVTPNDYAQDPVTGRLVGLSRDEVVLERRDARAGTVHVHFPRLGFRVEALDSPGS